MCIQFEIYRTTLPKCPHVLVELSSPQGDPGGASRYPERGLHQISEGIKQRKHAPKMQKKIGAHRDREDQTFTPKFDPRGQNQEVIGRAKGGKNVYRQVCDLNTRPRRDFLSSFLVRVAGKRVRPLRQLAIWFGPKLLT